MNRTLTYDVVIAGGGPAGVAAAMGAAQAGAKTLLLERNSSLGGESTNSCVAAFCGFHSRGNPPVQVVDGAGGQVLAKLRALGASTEYIVSAATGNSSIRFNPELLKLALDLVVAESEADCLLHTMIAGADTADGSITRLRCVDDAGEYTVLAKSFVDATGDGNLARMAGCATRWGDANGVTQLASLVTRIDRIAPDAETSPAAMEQAIRTAKAEGMSNLEKERGFLLREEGADYGFLTTPSTAVNALDAQTLTLAEGKLRLQAHAYVRALRQYLPGMENCRLVSTGPTLGLRETRRIAGRETLTIEDVTGCRKRPDSIARGGWSPEVHRGVGISYTHLEDGAWFDIPIGAIQARDMTNLWCAGRNISCDQTAHASVRVMGTAFATGHAAGVTAALTQNGTGEKLAAIRAELTRQGALL